MRLLAQIVLTTLLRNKRENNLLFMQEVYGTQGEYYPNALLLNNYNFMT